MKKKSNLKRVGLLSLVFLIIVSCIPIKTYAEDEEVIVFEEVAVERTEEKEEELLEIYQMLFPEEYHYLIEYNCNGVHEVENNQIEMIVHKSAEYREKTYELIVMNNGQVFLICNKTESLPHNLQPRYPVNGTYYCREFEVGTMGHYVTFEIEYLIRLNDYDRIINCKSISGIGFILYPFLETYQPDENADGPAHYGFNNVSMEMNGTGALYDLGVIVGRNKATTVIQQGQGLDMWLWVFLYAFLPE